MMRDPIVIVGAGATAVHFAATALALGAYLFTMYRLERRRMATPITVQHDFAADLQG